MGYVGNYVPYKYDLKRFMCIHSVTYGACPPRLATPSPARPVRRVASSR